MTNSKNEGKHLHAVNLASKRAKLLDELDVDLEAAEVPGEIDPRFTNAKVEAGIATAMMRIGLDPAELRVAFDHPISGRLESVAKRIVAPNHVYRELSSTIVAVVEKARALRVKLHDVTRLGGPAGATASIKKASRLPKQSSPGLTWTQGEMTCRLVVARGPFTVQLELGETTKTLLPTKIIWAEPDSISSGPGIDGLRVILEEFPVTPNGNGTFEVEMNQASFARRLDALNGARSRRLEDRILLLMPRLAME